MLTKINTEQKPVTLILKMGVSGLFNIRLFTPDGQLIYFRDTVDDIITINVPQILPFVMLETNTETRPEVIIKPLKFPTIPLPTMQHIRPYKIDDIVIVKNEKIDSPARIFTNEPIIEINPRKMAKYPQPIRVFILFHELGHLYFTNESGADLFAIISFINRGYNLSTALFALTKILGESKENLERIILADKALRKISLNYVKQ